MVAHVSAMAAVFHLINVPALASLAWVLLATFSLVLGFRIRDRFLGQSSLLLFLLSGVKIILFDLANTAPILRVCVLLVLGISLYGGGWIYRKLPVVESLGGS